MSSAANSRQATPEFTSTASHSTGEDFYQDPPTPPTPEGEYSGAHFSLDPKTLFDHPFSGDEFEERQQSHYLSLQQAQAQASETSFQGIEDPADFEPWPLNNDYEGISFEGTAPTGSSVITADPFSGINHFITPAHDVHPGARLNAFPLQSIPYPPCVHDASQVGYCDFGCEPAGAHIPVEAYRPQPTQAHQQHQASRVAIPPTPMPIKTPSTTFNCPLCHKGFGRQGDLARHTKTACQKLDTPAAGFSCRARGCKHKEKRKDKILLHCQRVHKQERGHEKWSPPS